MSFFSKQKISFMIGACLLATAAAAQQYYLVGLDSNSCKLKKSQQHDYVPSTECACMPISTKATSVEWVAHYGDPDNPSYCMPVSTSNLPLHQTTPTWPESCDKGDGCTQYECLRQMESDTSEQPLSAVTVSLNQCYSKVGRRGRYKKLQICNQYGYDCHPQ